MLKRREWSSTRKSDHTRERVSRRRVKIENVVIRWRKIDIFLLRLMLFWCFLCVFSLDKRRDEKSETFFYTQKKTQSLNDIFKNSFSAVASWQTSDRYLVDSLDNSFSTSLFLRTDLRVECLRSNNGWELFRERPTLIRIVNSSWRTFLSALDRERSP